MENASKALIIAGAILLAILIIGLGMMVFNNVRQRAGDTSAIDELAVQQFNSPFVAYFGDKVSGSNLKALLEKIMAHNRIQDDTSLQISVFNDTTNVTTNLRTAISGIQVGKTYTVDATATNGYDANSGYLTSITYKVN